MTNGKDTIETNEFLKVVWERVGFVEVKETKEFSYQELKAQAKEKGINIFGKSKEELTELLK